MSKRSHPIYGLTKKKKKKRNGDFWKAINTNINYAVTIIRHNCPLRRSLIQLIKLNKDPRGN